MESPATVYYPDGTERELTIEFETFYKDVYDYLCPPDRPSGLDLEFTVLSTNPQNPWHILIKNETVETGTVYALCDVQYLAKYFEHNASLIINPHVCYPRLPGVGPEHYNVWGPVIWVHNEDPRDA